MVQSSDKKRYVVLRLCDIRNKKRYVVLRLCDLRNKKKYSPLPPFLLEAEI